MDAFTPPRPSRWLLLYSGLSRAVLWAVLGFWLLFALLWGGLQWAIVPRIGDFRGKLEEISSKALGVQVRIGALRAHPDGLVPEFELTDVRLLDAAGRDALRLPTVRAVLTPRSLWERGFERLTLENPQLDVRRLADGRIQVAGLDVSTGGSDDTTLADWVFSQRELVVRGGTLRWSDEQVAKERATPPPPLAVQQLDLLVRNGARSHTLRLDATPPADWGSRFSLMGQFRQPLLSGRPGDLGKWSGQAFAHFAWVDLAQLRHYLHLGPDLRAGRGALRAWGDIAHGQIQSATADLALAEVDAQLGSQLLPLALQSITGRLAVRRVGAGGLDFAAQNLHFATRDGAQWPEGDLHFVQTLATSTQAASGELQADRLDLAALTQIANRLPLGTATHALLGTYAPQGRLNGLQLRWSGEFAQMASYEAQGAVAGLALVAQPAASRGNATTASLLPGLRGAHIDFKLSQNAGSAKVQISQGALELPGVLEDPTVLLDQLSADVQWKNQANGQLEVSVPSARFANADAQGEVKATWHTHEGKQGAQRFPGVLDLQGTLSRADGTRVYRYLPQHMGKDVRDYLRSAIVAGTASAVKLRMRGDLAHMPADDPKQGEFLISGQVAGATFAYAPNAGTANNGKGGYPPLQQLSGELIIDLNTLEVRNASARIAGAPLVQITRAQARIPDLIHTTTVVVTAEARGPLAEMVGVVNSSRLSGLLGDALTETKANGPAELKLRLVLPVLNLDNTKVQGTVTLLGNDVHFSSVVPPAARARGAITFNETGLGVASVQGQFLGGEARLESVPRPAGAALASASEPFMVLRAQGVASAEGMRQAPELGPLAKLAQNASGQAAYSATIGLRRGTPDIAVTSTLQGMALQLPVPLAKTADTALPLRFESSMLPGNQDQLLLELGKLASVTYQRDVSGDEARVLRGAIGIGLSGGETAPLPPTGVVANIQLPRLDVDAWEKLLSKASGTNLAAATAGRGRGANAALGYLPTSVALRATELVADGRTLHNVVVGGTREGLTWRANMDARELSGYVEYRQSTGTNPGRLYARLARMDIGQAAQADIETTLDSPSASVPALDIVVEDLVLRGKVLGRVEIEAANRGAAVLGREGGVREWRLNRFNVITPEATLSASGNWAALGASSAGASSTERRRTVLNFKLDIADAGGLLTRLGQSGVIRRGKGKMEGQVSWIGSPLALDYPSMGGQFSLKVDQGQFLKTDPGIAKLLGVLSLQSLPRRLALDFRDVFSEGFAFDVIEGDVRIEQGVALTNNLKMNGVNAGVLMEGSADLARETQDLKVVVIPEINAGTFSLLTTFINPAVGVGTFLAQLILRRPLIAASTQEFHIGGSWLDPKMTKVVRKTAVAAP